VEPPATDNELLAQANVVITPHVGSLTKTTYREMCVRSVENVLGVLGGGEPLAGPLSRKRLFPPAMIDMIAVAEESNNLEKVLIEIADTQEERTGRQIDLFVKLLEPLMLLVMGVMVLFIAVALLLPILSMATSGMHG